MQSRKAIILYKAEQNGVTLSDEEKTQLDTQVNGIISTYGEDGFGLRARTMGISSVKQYAKMYAKVMALQKAEQDISKNADADLPRIQACSTTTFSPTAQQLSTFL